MYGLRTSSLAIFLSFVLTWPAIAAEGNAARGRRMFGACAACHSLEAGRNMTGPSLANLWNRKAGTLSSFTRYSDALKSANIIWNDRTLDDWIKDPQHVVPGNEMPFAGMESAQSRADLLAYLKVATQQGASPPAATGGGMGGMKGMMGGGDEGNLKALGPAQRVQSITYCKDTFVVTTANGKTRKFLERNLRFMTDSSDRGPERMAPVLLKAGMLGDRADVIFSDPSEISPFVISKC